MNNGSLKNGRLLITAKRAADRLPIVQQPYSKKGRTRGQKRSQGIPRLRKAKMRFTSKSRQVLHFRRRRIYRGVEQPGSSSVRTHIAKNQLVLTFIQQLYSRIAGTMASALPSEQHGS